MKACGKWNRNKESKSRWGKNEARFSLSIIKALIMVTRELSDQYSIREIILGILKQRTRREGKIK